MSSVLSRLDSPELRASIYQFTVYLPGGVASVFLGIWLSERGIPADQIGVINALPTLALLLLNIIVGRVADKAVQIFGGAGYTADHGIERLYRDVRIFRIYEGTSQIQQVVIARETLKRGG